MGNGIRFYAPRWTLLIFFTACEYTLIGEEFFAASAYLSDKPELVGAVKGQDVIKVIILFLIFSGVLLRMFFDLGYLNLNILDLLTVR